MSAWREAVEEVAARYDMSLDEFVDFMRRNSMQDFRADLMRVERYRDEAADRYVIDVRFYGTLAYRPTLTQALGMRGVE